MAKDDILRKASKKLGDMVSENEQARLQPEQDRRDFISALAKEVVNTLSPLIAGLTMQSKEDKRDMMRAIASIDVNVPPIQVPQIKVPEINVPTPKVTVNPPMVKVPQINVPKATINFPDSMDVGLRDFNNKRPLPVMMFDAKGKPQSFSMGAGGGGRADFLKIKDILTSTGASIINDAGQLKTDAGTPTLSLDYGNGISDPGETGGTTARMVMATDAIASVNVVDAFGSTSVTGLINADDRLRVSVETGGSGLTDAELRASHLDINQVSGTELSTVVNSGTIDTVTTITNDVSIDDGGNSITIDGTLTGITNDVNIADGGNSITVDGTVAVSGITNTVAANVVDSTGVAYSGSNPVPITAPSALDVSGATVTVDLGANNDVVAAGDIANDAADSGNPIKIGGKAYTTNPTAVASADRVDARFDVVGRQVMRPLQVRDLLQTAFAAVTNGTETTLLAGASGVYHDLVYMVAANHSDAAVQVDIRQTTGGTIQMSLDVPANATAGLSLGGATIPQDHADATWTVDLADDTQDCDITALFSKEV